VRVRCLSLLILLVSLSACGSSATSTTLVSYVPIEAELPKTPLEFSSHLPSNTSAEIGKEIASAETITEEHEAEPGLVARVNNQPIFLEAYEKQVIRFEQTLTAQGIELASQSGQAILVQVRQQVLETLVDQLIIEQQAAKLNVIVMEQTVEAEAQIIAQAQSQAQFEAWLAANNLSFEEFKETLRSQLIANQVFETVTSSVFETTEKERAFNDWLLKQRSVAVIEWYVAF
jgi:hypothetical protein